MSGNILNRTLDKTRRPASLSAATVDGLLRDKLGWAASSCTDDLGAVAITSRFERAEAVALAIEAGNDMLLFANQATERADAHRPARRHDRRPGRLGRITEARIDASIARLDLWPRARPPARTS